MVDETTPTHCSCGTELVVVHGGVTVCHHCDEAAVCKGIDGNCQRCQQYAKARL